MTDTLKKVSQGGLEIGEEFLYRSLSDVLATQTARFGGLGFQDEAQFQLVLSKLSNDSRDRIVQYLLKKDRSDSLADSGKAKLFRLIITTLPTNEERLEVLNQFVEFETEAEMDDFFEAALASQHNMRLIAKKLMEFITYGANEAKEMVLVLYVYFVPASEKIAKAFGA